MLNPSEVPVPTAFAYEDLLLVPGESRVLPAEVDISTQFTQNVALNIPYSSAAMDTVTEAPMGIAMAQFGGIGVIHKNMSPEAQAAEVDKVKRSESGMIKDPITITRDKPISAALAEMNKYRISGIPVIDERMRLIGIITNRDLRFETDVDRLVGEVMTKEGLVTTTPGTTIEEARAIFQKRKIEKLPILDEDGILRGLITVKDIQKRRDYPQAAKDSQGRLLVAAAVGPGKDLDERLKALIAADVDVIVIDTAHGHSHGVLAALRKAKEMLPSGIDVVAGNVATAAATKMLIEAGANAIKVGMGAGSICTTRIISGAGMPQLTAVAECSRVAAAYGVPVIADGGIKYSGDVTKAIAAGASSAMIGSEFAGTDEAPGETTLYQGRSYKDYRGMGSDAAMRQRHGSASRYGQEQVPAEKLVPEGVEGRVPLRGPLLGVVTQYVGGLRAGMGYVGCATISELKNYSGWVQITNAGLKESHVHGVLVVKEAPNYRT